LAVGAAKRLARSATVLRPQGPR